MSTQGEHSKTDQGKKVNIVNERKGHRAYITKIIGKTNQLLENYATEHDNRLLSYKTSLTEKLYLLDTLNEQVLFTIPDTSEDYEQEIVRSNEIKDDINEVVIAIDAKLKVNEILSATHP